MPTEGINLNNNNIESELYFLITRFLKSGPCSKAYKTLIEEVEEHKLLPKRVDWMGYEHDRTYDDLIRSNPNISSDHLLKLCNRLGPVLNKENSSCVAGVNTLLGVGKHSLLRTKEETAASQTVNPNTLVARYHHQPPLLPHNLAKHPNISQILTARELSGPVTPQQLLPTRFYKCFQSYCRRLGHLSSVYCVLFDRTGKYIFTGADDLLVKIWNAIDGRLLSTLRGHSAEITDMAVNYENTLLAAGSCDKIIRVWCLKTTVPVAILTGHTAMITSIKFCPCPKGVDRYLVSTGNDGCIFFWQWNVVTSKFNLQPRKFTERNRPGAQMQCCSFSPGGVFVATGSTDHHVRVYNLYGGNGPERILEMEAHSDRVDSIQFANTSERFVTGSKDGTALIYKFERQSWRKIHLRMTTKLPSDTSSVDDNKIARLRVTMVGWDLEDRYVITAVNDHSIKVWNSYTGTLIYHLEGHEDEVFVIESHPTDSRVFLSAGHDGRIILWDLQLGTPIKKFFNVIEGQGHGAVFDCKFSPDGRMFASTDSHGHLSIFGFGSNEKYQKIPTELFFHTDYRPLIRDANHHVLDEQTQVAPHLMPPPFLVNIDGNPYPPEMQRLVPGKEHCTDSQLVPLVINSGNGQDGGEIVEVIRPIDQDQPPPPPSPSHRHGRSNLDVMIERLQREQSRNNTAAAGSSSSASSSANINPSRPPQAQAQGIASHGRVGTRRSGDVEGVRQSYSNWQSSSAPSQGELLAWSRRVVVKNNEEELIKTFEWRRLALSELELARYKVEKKKRPVVAQGEVILRKKCNRARTSNSSKIRSQRTSRRSENNNSWSRYSNNDYENPDMIDLSSSNSSDSDDDRQRWKHTSSDSSSESSEYSDWTQDTGLSLRPPKRQASKLSEKRRYQPANEHIRRSKRGARQVIEDEDDQDDKPSTSSVTTNNHVNKKERRKVPEIKEIPPKFRPSEWLSWTVPRSTPYYPQMGDEVIYFLQGHKCYLNAVNRSKIYKVNEKSQPWHRMHLREQELVKVVGIKYEIRPPRLCCLKLARIDPENGRITSDQAFTIKYHDMPDVIDFLVLRQTYDTAMSRNWKANDRFRALIDNGWWVGTITSQEPFEDKYPDSMFQCFNVAWDNGEREKMSPWDLELLVQDRMPAEHGGCIEVLPEELKSLLWKPIEGEWPPHGMDAECDRILDGLSQIMELAVAEPFLAPVDLNAYPEYAFIVAYPIDVSIIKARLENRFYRRITSLQFDVRFIESNTRLFNEPKSKIVQHARMVTDLCLRLIEDALCTDIKAVYQILGSINVESDSDEEDQSHSSNDDDDAENSEDDRNEAKYRKGRKKEELQNSNSWKGQCLELLDYLIQREDSEPFRSPVDPILYPDYRDIIDNPMDFSTQKTKLLEGKYQSPIDFCRDSRLIFQNSRNFNTNKRSRIYSMTIRMSAMFEELIRLVISDWKSAVKYEQKVRNNCFVTDRRRPLPRALPDLDSSRRTRSRNINSSLNVSNGRKTSKQRLQKKKPSRKSNSIKRRIHSSDDDDDNENKDSSSNRQKRETNKTITDKSRRSATTATTSVTNGYVLRDSNRNKKCKTLRPSKQPQLTKLRSISEDEDVDVEENTDLFSSSEDEVDEPQTRNLRSGTKWKEDLAANGASSTRSRSKRKKLKHSGSSSSSSSNSSASSSSSNSSNNNNETHEHSNRSTNSSASSSTSNGNSRSSGDSSSESENDEADKTKERKLASSDDSDSEEEEIGVRRSKRTTTRSTNKRVKKRRKIEDSDEEYGEESDEGNSARRSKRIATKKRSIRYREDSDFEYEFDSAADEDNGSRVSVSSRGRVRKLTQVARKFIRT